MAKNRAKVSRRKIIQAKIEATTGTEEALTSTEYLEAFEGSMTFDNTYNERQGVGLGARRGVAGAQSGATNFQTELRNSGTATLPLSAALLAAAGFKNTGGVFSLQGASDTGDVATIGMNVDGRFRSLAGVAFDITITGEVGKRVMVEWKGKGKRSIGSTAGPRDVTPITFTPLSGQPPVVKGITATIGAVAYCISKFSIAMGNDVQLRPCAGDPTGYLAAQIVARKIVITLDPEQRALSTKDFYADYENGVEAALSIQIGSGTNGTVTIAATKIQPTQPPDDTDGSGIARDGLTFGANEGFKKKMRINGTTVEFDATVGLGVDVAMTLADRARGNGHPFIPYYNGNPFDGTGTPFPGAWDLHITAEAIDAEQTRADILLTAQPVPSSGWDVQVGFNATGERQRQFHWEIVTRSDHSIVSSEPQYSGFVVYLDDTTAPGVGIGVASTPTAYSSQCSGGSQDGDLHTPAGSVLGHFSASLLPPDAIHMNENAYSARGCPCAIRLGGTLYVTARTDTGKAVSPDRYPWLIEEEVDPETGEPITEASGQPPIALAAATLDIRLTRDAGASCGHPPAVWSNYLDSTNARNGTVTIGGTSHPAGAVEIRRIGPRLYAVSLELLEVETNDEEGHNVNTGGQLVEFHVVVEGDCPADVQATEPFAQTHHYTQADAATAPTLVPVNPSITTPFTANAVTLTGVDREAGDPACGCHEVGPYDPDADAAADAMVDGILAEGDA